MLDARSLQAKASDAFSQVVALGASAALRYTPGQTRVRSQSSAPPPQPPHSPNRYVLHLVTSCSDLNGWPAWLNVAVRAEAQVVSARRRRERRLRSMLRHERMAVAMAVAEATHQSSRGQNTATAIREEVVQVTHEAPRGQKTPPLGVRPGSLAEPGPKRSDRSLRRSSGEGLPLLATPSSAGAASEVVDSSSLRFLAASALKRKDEEKEKEKVLRAKEEEEEEAQPGASPSTFAFVGDAKWASLPPYLHPASKEELMARVPRRNGKKKGTRKW